MSDQVPEKFNKCLLYLLIILIVITGSFNTILMKCIQKIESLGKKFEDHHWFTTHGMFSGELIPLFFYIYIYNKRKKQELKEKKNKEKERNTLDGNPQEKEKKKPKILTNFIFSITAVCDLLGDVLSYLGLIYLSSSLYQMMKGVLLVFICILSKIFLNNPIYKHHILGIGSLFFGIFLVGLSALIYSDEDKKIVKHPLIGIALLITSELIVSICFVFQEIFIKNYDVHPLQLVGFEGLWGFIIISIILIIFQFITRKQIEADIKLYKKVYDASKKSKEGD